MAETRKFERERGFLTPRIRARLIRWIIILLCFDIVVTAIHWLLELANA